ncbi:hypothetical protein [Listeria sp. PSOL-1]|nr:hypothetical protein [Listeria sp. PSOL-1]
MLRIILILTAIIFPAFLCGLVIYQIYKKKTANYMPLKNEFAHWIN